MILITAVLLSCQISPVSRKKLVETSRSSQKSLQGITATRPVPTLLRSTPLLSTMQYSTTGTEAFQIIIKRNMTYCKVDGVHLKADLFLPASATEPTPLLIHIHGGGWTSGDKRESDGFMEFYALVQAGFAVASINYRLAPEYKMADMIADVRCSVRSFRAHAAEYNLNPDRFGVWGESAGAQLSALLGTMEDEISEYDNNEFTAFSNRVQAVVDLFGPSDFIFLFYDGRKISLGPTTVSIFGSDDIYDPIYTYASPTTHISKDDPPFLIVHGDKDEIIPVSQSQEFFKKLLALEVDAKMVIVKNGNHGLTKDGQDPSREVIMQMIIDFFTEKLRD